MEQAHIDEIIGCLPKGRTLFPYFKDRYALLLLSYFVDGGKPMRTIKQSRFGGLLDKPLLKQPVRTLPGAQLTQDVLANVWPQPEAYQTYRLTLGTWGPPSNWEQSWYQTSRPGKNLVLQLNFSSAHNRPYYALIRPGGGHPFVYTSHPVALGKKDLTMAWARLDVDLKTGEALIEEVQNDWIRLALWWRRRIETLYRVDEPLRQRLLTRCLGAPNADVGRLKRYVDQVLHPHVGLWDEAMLTATLWFLRDELGIRRIFFHTYTGGRRLKGMRHDRPPRSLYSRLPRRFCFAETDDVPVFLMAHRRVRQEVRKGDIRFFLLDV